MHALILLLAMSADDSPDPGPKKVKLPSGVIYVDMKEGTGAAAKAGNKLSVHYTGWLVKDGKKFDSSLDRKEAFVFELGKGSVIKGWDEGLVGMKPGGKRKLLIPAKEAYGEKGSGGTIPANADLIFEVELIKIE